MKKTQQVQTQSVGAAVQQNKQFYQNCVNKWKKLLVSEHVAPIENKHTRAVTAVLLENQANALMEDMNPNSSSIWWCDYSRRYLCEGRQSFTEDSSSDDSSYIPGTYFQ